MDHGESYHGESHQLTQDHKEEQEKEHMIKKKKLKKTKIETFSPLALNFNLSLSVVVLTLPEAITL